MPGTARAEEERGEVIPDAARWKGPPSPERVKEILREYRLFSDGWIYKIHGKNGRPERWQFCGEWR